MKYIVLHGDGLAGGPRKELGGKSPLEAAATPNMDAVASHGELVVAMVPADGPQITSGMVQTALLGYDPRKLYPGPGPLEAASLGVTVGEQDVVYRCSMVTLRGTAQGRDAYGDIKKLAAPVTVEGEAEHLEREEARELLEKGIDRIGADELPRLNRLLLEAGFPVKPGSGVAAAQQVFAEDIAK